MLSKLKKLLYFPIASYFRFFAGIRLQRWKPYIVVITGSSGKTTLLHLLEAQIGNKAKYSHHANSSFGIPFDILDLQRKSLLKREWITLFLFAPFNAFLPPPQQSFYVVEADCDRPNEGKFLASFLKPQIVLWVSSSKTHSMNFDSLTKGNFSTVEEAIAYEFGYFLEYCSDLVVINGDSQLEMKQQDRIKAKEVKVVKKDRLLQKYAVKRDGTLFRVDGLTYSFHALLPEESFYAIAMCKQAVAYLGLPFDASFRHFIMPPGRGTLFEGIKNTGIIDSCYNLSPASLQAVLSMYNSLEGTKKWAVIGDMLELGRSEKEEHEKLADLLASYDFDRIILMGPRVSKYTYPRLVSLRGGTTKGRQTSPKQSREVDQLSTGLPRSFVARNDDMLIEKFLGPRETLDYLLANLQGGEMILFKGSRFMEGIIEHLLREKSDAARLARREKVWEMRRREWGL